MGASKHTGRCPNICGQPSILMVSKHMGASKHTGSIQTLHKAERCCQQCYTYGGNQTYSRAPRHPKHMGGASKHTGGASKHMGASKHCSRLISVASSITHMGATKHTAGHPNIWVVSKHMGASKHTGDVQT